MNHWGLARGYRYAGIHCGLRPDPNRRDLVLIVSDTPAAAAGVFTQNRVVAAPVLVCRERVPGDGLRGVVICSGNANACTGDQGLADARRMAALAAAGVGCRPEQMLVASTGVIGRPLPMELIEGGIGRIFAELRPDGYGLDTAAHAVTAFFDTEEAAEHARRVAFFGNAIPAEIPLVRRERGRCSRLMSHHSGFDNNST